MPWAFLWLGQSQARSIHMRSRLLHPQGHVDFATENVQATHTRRALPSFPSDSYPSGNEDQIVLFLLRALINSNSLADSPPICLLCVM